MLFRSDILTLAGVSNGFASIIGASSSEGVREAVGFGLTTVFLRVDDVFL